MEALPTFPLFPDPVRERSIEQSQDLCRICDRKRGWLYVGPTYGELEGDDPQRCEDCPRICPWCIADGSAAARGVAFNDSTIYPCVKGNPQLPAADAKEVEERTPGFVTWQGNHWMMCCGRACVYLGEADSADLAGRWAGAVPSILEGCEDWSQGQKDDLIRSVVKGQGPCAYVFRCRVCGGLKGYWDIH